MGLTYLRDMYSHAEVPDLDERNETMSSKERNSSIELLRIISMVCIVLSHYCVHGGANLGSLLQSHFFNAYLLQIGVLGNLGINVFMCIFGFFNADNVDWRRNLTRCIRIALHVWVYSVLIYIVMLLTGQIDISAKAAIKAFFPVTFDEYGFPTVYIIIALFSPAINSGIQAMNTNTRNFVFLIGSLLWCVIPTVSLGKVSFYGTTFTQYLLLYCIGCYLKILCKEKKGLDPDRLGKIGGIVAVSAFLSLSAVTLIFDLIGGRQEVIRDIIRYFFNRESVFCVLTAAGSVLFFANKVIKPSKAINSIAALTFGIYLIHDNNYVRSILWTKLLHTTQFHGSDLFIFHMIGSVALVFTCCGIIEIIQKKTLGKVTDRAAKKFSDLLYTLTLKMLGSNQTQN